MPIEQLNVNFAIIEQLRELGELALGLSGSSGSQRQIDLNEILPAAAEDLFTYHQRDPSVRHKPVSSLISIYSTYFAVLSYRIAHHITTSRPADHAAGMSAMHLSFCARGHTGIEIHPDAVIGRRLVIDHGWGTVIGQTTTIGDDCYILNDVTLGGRAVANAPDGKRHPTLGDRVQVCARAKIFGPVTIGDDCFIGPDVTVTGDVPDGVTILNDFHPSRIARSPITLNEHSRSLA